MHHMKSFNFARAPTRERNSEVVWFSTVRFYTKFLPGQDGSWTKSCAPGLSRTLKGPGQNMHGWWSQMVGLGPGSIITKHSCFSFKNLAFDLSRASEVPATKSSLPAPTIDPRISWGRNITCFISFSTLPWESSQTLQSKSVVLQNGTYLDHTLFQAGIKGEYQNTKKKRFVLARGQRLKESLATEI